MEDKRGAIATARVQIQVLDWQDILNTPPVARGTSSFAESCNASTANGTNATASTPSTVDTSNNTTCVPAKVLHEGGSISFLLEASDKETARASLVFEIVKPPEHGAYSMVSEDPPVGSGKPRIGTLTYTPDDLWYGYDAVTFRVRDAYATSEDATVHFVVKPVNNPPMLACPDAAELAAAAASSAATAARATAMSVHPVCTTPIDGTGWLKPQLAAAVSNSHAVARSHLAPSDALPGSLRLGAVGGGSMPRLRALADAVVQTHGGRVPIVVTAGGSVSYTAPMGGGLNETAKTLAVAVPRAVANASQPANASATGAAGSESSPAVWGRAGEPVYLAIALLSYDPDDEPVAASTADGAPPPMVDAGGLADPVLTSPPDNGAGVFAVNADGSVGDELRFVENHGFELWAETAASRNLTTSSNATAGGSANASSAPRAVAVVPGAMLYLRVADQRRGNVTLRWRARDGRGVLSAREGVVTVTSACRAGYRRAAFWQGENLFDAWFVLPFWRE